MSADQVRTLNTHKTQDTSINYAVELFPAADVSTGEELHSTQITHRGSKNRIRMKVVCTSRKPHKLRRFDNC